MKNPKSKPLLTRVESEVMQALWELRQGTVHDVQAALGRPLAYTTVLSVLRILEQKGHVQHHVGEAHARAYIYLPAAQAHTLQRRHLSDLVQRLFGGHASALVTGLIQDEELSREELKQLRDMIDQRLGKNDHKESKT